VAKIDITANRHYPSVRTFIWDYRYPYQYTVESLQFTAEHFDIVIADQYQIADYPEWTDAANTIQLTYASPRATNTFSTIGLHRLAWRDSQGLTPAQYEAMFWHWDANATKSGTDELLDVEQFTTVWYYNGSAYSSIGTTTATQCLTDTDEYVYFGYTEGRFSQVRLTMSVAASGADLSWEYWDGEAWSALTVTDGTSDFAASGTVSFAPPTDWAWTKVSTDSYNAYYIRVKTTETPATPPTIGQRLQDRPVSYSSGAWRFYAWDSANDLDSDGWLNDAEYASPVNANATARFQHHARATYGVGNAYFRRFWMSADANAVAWHAQYLRDYADSTTDYNGVFEDNFASYNLSNIGVFKEAPNNTATGAAVVTQAAAVPAAFGDKVWAPNIASDLRNASAYDGFQYHDISLAETYAGMFAWQYDLFASRIGGVLTAMRSYDANIGIHWRWQEASAYGVSLGRDQVAALAAYYLCVYPSADYPTAGGVWLTYNHATNFTYDPQLYQWFGALEVDIGTPTSEMAEITASPVANPGNPGYYSKVYGRTFTKGKVLFKPLGVSSKGLRDSVCGDTSLTGPYSLGGTYRSVDSTGALGDPITEISLRNAEGAVLILQSEVVPPTINTFAATAESVVRGEAVTLSWTTTDANTVTLSGVPGATAADGSVTVRPTESTTYILTANGDDETTATAQLTVSVVAGNPTLIRNADGF